LGISPKKFENGATGDFQLLEKAAIGGPFCYQRRKFSETRTAWLTWEDSNFHITISKNAFEMSGEFPLFWPKFRLGDFCSHKLQFLLEKRQSHQWRYPRRTRSLAQLERGAAQRRLVTLRSAFRAISDC
jgi:hypothetical protein